MQVLCIKSSLPNDNSNPRIICVRKGCRYNVIRIEELGGITSYYLLETGDCWHCSTLFVPIVDDEVEVEEVACVESDMYV